MEQTTERTVLVLEILNKHFPIECEMAGSSNLWNIANGITKEVRATGGSNFDISQPLSLLIVSASFINSAIAICNAFQKRKEPIPAAPVIVINIDNQNSNSNTNTNNNTMTNDVKLNICQQIIDHVSANAPANPSSGG